MRFLIIGGSDAGIAAGLRAHELDSGCEVTLILADEFPKYSIYGLPFYLTGETPDWHSRAHRTEFPASRSSPAIRRRPLTPLGNRSRSAAAMERPSSFPTTNSSSKRARPVQPAIEGFELPGVFTLHTMEDSFAVHQFLEDRQPKSAVIVGAGYIGLEMADALTHRGIHVTVASRTETILATVDASLGRRVEAEMQQHGVDIRNGVQVSSIRRSGERLTVCGSPNFAATADFVLIVVGVQPNSELGAAAGIVTGAKGALKVNRRM